MLHAPDGPRRSRRASAAPHGDLDRRRALGAVGAGAAGVATLVLPGALAAASPLLDGSGGGDGPATGGEELPSSLIPVDGYTYHAFITPGTASLVVTSEVTVDYVVIAGGGGGGVSAGGGGGGGRVVVGRGVMLTVGTYTVTVGAGGVGQAGSDSTILRPAGTTFATRLGGGAGADGNGAGGNSDTRVGGSGGTSAGGGGGGNSGSGSNAVGGAGGGGGLAFNVGTFFANTVPVSGGGGGGGSTSGGAAGGAGGAGGSGVGAAAQDAQGFGGGGGGAYAATGAGAGGNGLVVFRYPTP